MSTLYCIENDDLRVCVSDMGAEMQSILHKPTGREQLWQGDSAIWADRAPWLFPVIGQLKGGCYQWQVQTYTMPMHGFAAGAIFRLLSREKERLVFSLTSSEATLCCYPFRFHLMIAYALRKGALHIDAAIHNDDMDPMYFSFGAHPGFLCSPGDTLTLNAPGKMPVYRLEAGSHLLPDMPTAECAGPVIPLEEALFAADAMIFKAPAASAATLLRQDGTGLTFSFGTVPYLGLWSRAGGGLPYLCIEPWFGVDDSVNADGRLTHKQGIQTLAPANAFAMAMCIQPF